MRTDLEFESISFLEDPIIIRKIVQKTILDLKRVQKSIKIYAGEAHWAIFDHPELLRTLRELRKNNVEIQIVVGPVISCGGGPNSPEIVKLAEEGVVELYYRLKGDPHPHFRIIDDRLALVEKVRHEPLFPLNLRTFYTKIDKNRQPEEFQRYLVEFNTYTKKNNLITNPRKQYLLLRSSEIRGIMKIAKQQGKDYDALTKSQIERLLEEVRSSKRQIREQFKKAISASR